MRSDQLAGLSILFVSGTRAGGSGLSQRQLAARLIARGHRVVILADPEVGYAWTRYLYRRQVNLSTKLQGRALQPLLLRLQRPFGRRTRAADDYDVPVIFSPIPENAYRDVRRWMQPDVVVASSIGRTSWRRLLAELRAEGTPSVLYLREETAQGHIASSGSLPDLLMANSETLADTARAAGHDCLTIPSVIETARTAVTTSRERVLLVNPLPAYGGDRLWPIARARPDIPFAVQESLDLPGDVRAHVLAEVAALPNVAFRPQTADVAGLYRDARLLLVPHRMDNRPRVVAEAQANGIPVIASDFPGLAEAVGAGGLLVDPFGDDAAWLEAVSSMWDDLGRYELLVTAARRHAARPEIDPDHVAARFEQALVALVSQVEAADAK